MKKIVLSVVAVLSFASAVVFAGSLTDSSDCCKKQEACCEKQEACCKK